MRGYFPQVTKMAVTPFDPS